jgi:hypothetical protein
VDGRLLSNPPLDEADVALGRPGPGRLCRVESAEELGHFFEAVGIPLEQFAVGGTLRLDACLRFRARGDLPPEIVHFGRMSHQVSNRPFWTARHWPGQVGGGGRQPRTFSAKGDDVILGFHGLGR